MSQAQPNDAKYVTLKESRKPTRAKSLRRQHMLLNPILPSDFSQFESGDYRGLKDYLAEIGINWVESTGNRDPGSIPPVMPYIYPMHHSLDRMADFVNEHELEGRIVEIGMIYDVAEEHVEVLGEPSPEQVKQEISYQTQKLREYNHELIHGGQDMSPNRRSALLLAQDEATKVLEALAKL